MGLAVYGHRVDGSYFYKVDGIVEDVHGLQKWQTLDGLPMRGKRPREDDVTRAQRPRRQPSYDDDLRHAVEASIHSEEDDLRRAIAASLAESEAASPVAAPESQEPPSCPVCLGSIDGDARALRCGHSFCASCIEPWLRTNTTCPVCRERV